MAPEELVIQKWVPANAADVLRSLWAKYVGEDDRKRLKRLGTEDLMRTDVWDKLPRSPGGLEGRFILLAFWCAREDVLRYVIEPERLPYQPLDVPWSAEPLRLGYGRIANLAATLRDAMFESGGTVAPLWPSTGSEDATSQFCRDLATLDKIHRRYFEMEQEWRMTTAILPRVRKRKSGTVREVVFGQLISVSLLKLYRREPNADVVAALTQVVFDLPGGVDSETVRSRWRAHRAAIASAERAASKPNPSVEPLIDWPALAARLLR